MKILHSADIHLRTVGDSRWQALEHLVRVAEQHSVALLVICGDLFDRHIDVHRLKSPLRDLFQDIDVQIILLPGNHDVRAVAEGDYYGENVTVLSRSDHFLDVNKVRVFALPFEKIDGEKILEKLLWIRQRTSSDKANILLYHGELLDMIYARDGFGDEDIAGYMPVRLSYFDGLGLDYVLAGHFHRNFEVRRYANGYFVYPGSPVSVTKKENGVRRANLFEVGKQPMPIELGTSHFEEVLVRLDPTSQEDPIATIAKRLDSYDDNARVLLTVSGFVDLRSMGKGEAEFAKEIGALMTPQVEKIDQHWNDVSAVVQSDLFERCMDKLAGEDMPQEQRSRVRELVMTSMMETQDAR